MIAFAKKLGCKNSGSAGRTPDAEYENKKELGENADSVHGISSASPNHKIIEKANEIGNRILNYNRKSNDRNVLKEFSVAEKFHKCILY